VDIYVNGVLNQFLYKKRSFLAGSRRLGGSLFSSGRNQIILSGTTVERRLSSLKIQAVKIIRTIKHVHLTSKATSFSGFPLSEVTEP
jgi:hypothetical protein